MSAGIMSLTAAFYCILLELPITSFRLLADLMMWSFPSVFRCGPSDHCSFTLCFAFGLVLIMHIDALHVLCVLCLIQLTSLDGIFLIDLLIDLDLPHVWTMLLLLVMGCFQWMDVSFLRLSWVLCPPLVTNPWCHLYCFCVESHLAY